MTRHAQWGYDTGINDLLPGERSTRVDYVTTHFGDVTAAADAFIRDSQALVGAVAWVRSPRLLDALSTKPVSLIVNKEFAIRRKGTKERAALDKLRRPAPGLEVTARVLGDCSHGAFTGLMHHKFLVRLVRGIPAAVWVGSFNFTSGAAGNFESAVEIHDPAVAVAFYDEFRRMWEIAEPLDFRQGRPAAPQRRATAPARRAPAAPAAARKPKPATKPRTPAARKPKPAAAPAPVTAVRAPKPKPTPKRAVKPSTARKAA